MGLGKDTLLLCPRPNLPLVPSPQAYNYILKTIDVIRYKLYYLSKVYLSFL